MNRKSLFCFLVLLSTASFVPVHSQDVPEPAEPLIAAATDEGIQAIDGFKFPSNIKATLFAAEPDVANPVAFSVDHKGRVFVCESFRQEKGVEDNRRHPYWLDDELAAKSVDDRVVYMKKHFPDNWSERFQTQDDQIRLLEDKDNDGVADSSIVYSNKYNALTMGTGAGVLHYRGDTFFTCIPDLWLLRDEDNDDVAESRKSLHNGYGVRFAFRGHDLHGLVIGPDGRLYYSIGDRGYDISEGMKDPASGAVFRCELDGTNVEVVATGLRNPQELAFDDYGNLFTGDNNSDSGDKARWVYVVPGSDTGWRMYYQYLDDRGPFNRERIWYPYDKETTPAYIVPPIDNLGDGPSGLTYYPGTGFGDEFQGRFFMCDFRGAPTTSGIRSFRNEADGAFFKLTDLDQPFWQMLVTDVDFGPDGKMYTSDWIFGWIGENKGRIYTFHDPVEHKKPIVQQVQSLLAGGIEELKPEALVELLGHQDRRVRQEAQFKLVRDKNYDELMKTAESDNRQFARLHAIWGVEQMDRLVANSGYVEDNRAGEATRDLLAKLLSDSDAQIRAHAAKAIGELNQFDLADQVASLLGDPDLRVQHFAGVALSRIGSDRHLTAICKMIAANADKDPIVRHSGIMAMTRVDSNELMNATLVHPSRSVRLAAVVALRKQKAGAVANFLFDKDKQVQLEAVRTVHDVPIAEGIGELATLISRTNADDALIRRAINANVIFGEASNAEAIAKFAADPSADEDRRMDALNALATWGDPPSRDPVLGDWRPIGKRDNSVARSALAKYFARICNSSDRLKAKTLLVAGDLKLENISDELTAIVFDDSSAATARAAALQSLAAIEDPSLVATAKRLAPKYNDLPTQLAGALSVVAAQVAPELAMTLVNEALEGEQVSDSADSIYRRQQAIASMGKMTDGDSAEKLSQLLNAVAKTDYVPHLRLDVLNAVKQRSEPFFKAKLEKYHADAATKKEASSRYVDVLFGGDAAAGQKIFSGKTEVSCVRCHKIDWVGGEVGPDLSLIGKTKDRKYLLEAIVEPNKVIAEGFAQMVVATADGFTHTGIVSEKSDDLMLRLLDADGQLIAIPRDDIDDSRMGMSSMPKDLVESLTMKELRDLIEYLANRRAYNNTLKPDDEGHE